MFGGKWGAFESTDCHFFNPENPIYKEITRVSTLRHREPALRYGRQYFRQISLNVVDSYHPADSKSTLAYSRILDTTEVLVAMNLEGTPRNDFISVDTSLNTAGEIMVNLLDPGKQVTIEQKGPWHAVRTPLEGHEFAIFRKVP